MTKTLYFLRHGKAEPHDARLSDYDRKLEHIGVEQTQATAKKAFAESIHFDQIISSTAARAWSTAIAFAEEFKFPEKNIIGVDWLHNAPAQSYLDALSKYADEASLAIVFVGHNPGISDVVSLLTGTPFMDMGLSNLAKIHFQVENWQEISEGSGKLLSLLKPKV